MALSYGPRIGQCIYCGAYRYSSHREKLGREHVIPRGLGGRLTVLEASCHSCENIINQQAENICLSRDMLGPLRYRLGLKRSGTDYIPIGIYHGSYVQDILVPIDEAPIGIAMPIYQPPKILSRLMDAPIERVETPQAEMPARSPFIYNIDDPHTPGLFVRIEGEKAQALVARTNSRRIRCYKVIIQRDALFRMIAKVAHSYVVYSTGGVTFKPFLQNLILGKKSSHPINHYIGGDPPLAQYMLPNKIRHRLELELVHGAPKLHESSLLVVNIHLFSDIGFPPFKAVVGRYRK